MFPARTLAHIGYITDRMGPMGSKKSPKIEQFNYPTITVVLISYFSIEGFADMGR